jgi:hypothetical protein
MNMPAARPGDVVRLIGRHLGGVTTVQVTGNRLKEPVNLPVTEGGQVDIAVSVPDRDKLIPAGTVLLTPLAPASEARGNTVALRLAPTIVISNPPLEVNLSRGRATVKLGCKPPVQAGQTVQLIVGDRIVTAATPMAATSELTFRLTEFSAGRYLLRLRIDDQDSIPIDRDNPLAFDDSQHLVLR